MTDQNRHSPPKRRPHYGSIDGFAPKKPAAPIPLSRPHSLSKMPAPTASITPMPKKKMPAMPQKPALSDIERSESMLNTTIPGYQGASFATRKNQKAKKLRKKWTKKRIAVRSALVVLLILIGIGGFLGVKGLNTLDKIFHGNIISDITASFNDTPLKGESTGRVNILLAGDSSDDPGHAGADLTDSILLLSIDTKNHTAFLLSIPRDLWVYIPGLNSYQKINSANTVTNFDQSGYPSGGMGQLEQVIQTQLGIPIDYYGLMDYSAFRDSVNAVGGVTITIQSPDPRGLYDPYTHLKLPNGPVTLDGNEALNLARARGDGPGSYGFPDSDFDRTAHQRQLFTAVAEKAKSVGVLTNPVKISDLFSALGDNFNTNLTLQNVLRLIHITKGINLANVQSYSFSSTLSSTSPHPLLETYTDPASGEEALSPSAGVGDFGQLEEYYQQLSSSNPIVKEQPSVVILNASQKVGLASYERSQLQSKGFNVTAIADANNEYPNTMVVNNAGTSKPNSLKLLEQLYPGLTSSGSTGSVEANEAQNYTSDFVVILGQNWNNANTSVP
jgi:LCP family protein required for cell wall assembly